MKKYIIICLFLMIILIVIYYLENYTSFIFFAHKDIKTNITVQNKDIYLNNELFYINAINIGSSKSGTDDADYAINYDDYMRWFKMISELNINTIRVFNIQSPTFYKALYDYNQKNKKNLYLIQGTDVGDYLKNSTNSYFDGDTYDDIFKNIKCMVDVIHGKRIITRNKEYASGIYTKDVSKYTLGYIIGTEWNDVTIEYTNQKHKDKKNYNGKYFYSSKNAKPFEVYLTQILDNLVDYESKKYGEQRLVSIGNTSITDPFEYDSAITDFYKKITSFDISKIKQKKSFKSSMFAAFQVYSAYPDFYGYDDDNSYYDYLKKLNDYYKIPLVISEFGYSTARLTNLNPANDIFGNGIYNEVEQGEMIVKSIEMFRSLDINNFILYEWADEFDKSSWNTMYAVDVANNQNWNNVLTYSQHFGLLSYDTYTNNNKIIMLDGETDDWDLSKSLIDNDNYKLYISYDSAYINLLIENKKGNFDDKLYIPIDITPNSGTKKSNIGKLSFTNNVDFLIEIDGINNAKTYVQDYYNPIRALYGKQVYLHNQFEKDNIPKKNSSNFENIVNIIAYQNLIKNNDSYTIENEITLFNTGYLNYGTTDVDSENYNSLADYYIVNNIMEIRIPYGLLNFSDPSHMMIHDDYYKNLGVEYIKINNISVGLGKENSKIKLYKFDLRGWGRTLKSKERLKSSYYILKEYLRKS